VETEGGKNKKVETADDVNSRRWNSRWRKQQKLEPAEDGNNRRWNEIIYFLLPYSAMVKKHTIIW
jgi:hypothetical protein